MTISVTTHKRLWGNAGRRCAFPGCEQSLFIPMEAGEDEVAIGKECHIVGKADTGPRGPASLSEEEADRWKALIDNRDGYPNLILLCGVHHDVVDGDVAAYTVTRLVEMKRAHEQAVLGERPSTTLPDEQAELRYSAIVDEWARRIDIDRWDGRMSGLVSSAMIREEVIDELEPLRDWLLRRVWPRTIPALEDAFLNFRAIAEDLDVVANHFATRRNGTLFVDRVYKEVSGARANRENLEFLERRSEYFQDLAADLAVELTRAVNLVCDRVRAYLWPSYRLDSGYSTIGVGMNASLIYLTLRPLYALDCPDVPYSGLKEFLSERSNRDWVRGDGFPPEGTMVPGVRD